MYARDARLNSSIGASLFLFLQILGFFVARIAIKKRVCDSNKSPRSREISQWRARAYISRFVYVGVLTQQQLSHL